MSKPRLTRAALRSRQDVEAGDQLWRKDARAYANVELSEENDRLIAENERLRAALQNIVGLDGFERTAFRLRDAQKIASRALEQKAPEQHLTPEEQTVMHDALRRSAKPQS